MELEEKKQQLRDADRLQEFKIAFNISSIKLIGPLYPFFWIADLLHSYENKYVFLVLRLTVPLYCFALYYFYKNTTNLKTLQRSSIMLITYPSLVITALMYLSDGIGSVYFAGLNLISAGAICFFPWTLSQIPIVVISVYGPYFTLPLIMRGDAGALAKFGVNLFFVIGTILISVVIRYIYEELKNKEMRLRLDLGDEIENRNVIIKNKTDEAVKLSFLSKQFSPQVVHAIQDGKLDLSGSTKRGNICAIFIDIVNSTERVARIDKDDLNKVLSMFMSDTMKIFLKYDITIDKFLGDGVLGFSNAPLVQKDYVKRVLEAAVEIKNRIIENRSDYIELWKKELEVKIGIDAGYANVGFYGGDEYFKTYTAIGNVVNLSSRLCSIAEPNQILISGDIFKVINGDDAYITKDLGLRKIKGFETDMIKVFELDSSRAVVNSNIPMCQNGHGVLNLDVNEKGIYVFKCRVCNSESGEFDANNIKAKKSA